MNNVAKYKYLLCMMHITAMHGTATELARYDSLADKADDVWLTLTPEELKEVDDFVSKFLGGDK